MKALKNKKYLLITAFVLAVLLLSAVIYYCVENGYSPLDVRVEGSYTQHDGYYAVRMIAGENEPIQAKRKFVQGSKNIAFLAAGKDLEQIELTFCKKNKTDIISTSLLKEGESIIVPEDTKIILAKPTEVTGLQDVYIATLQFVME